MWGRLPRHEHLQGSKKNVIPPFDMEDLFNCPQFYNISLLTQALLGAS